MKDTRTAAGIKAGCEERNLDPRHAFGLMCEYAEALERRLAQFESKSGSGQRVVPRKVFDALVAWSCAEPSQSVLARAVNDWAAGCGDGCQGCPTCSQYSGVASEAHKPSTNEPHATFTTTGKNCPARYSVCQDPECWKLGEGPCKRWDAGERPQLPSEGGE